jgi:hypothetical protein
MRAVLRENEILLIYAAISLVADIRVNHSPTRRVQNLPINPFRGMQRIKVVIDNLSHGHASRIAISVLVHDQGFAAGNCQVVKPSRVPAGSVVAVGIDLAHQQLSRGIETIPC